MNTNIPVSVGAYADSIAQGGVRPLGVAQSSAVSWAAVFAGAAAAAALSLILLALGSGLGFSAISPWAGAGTSATALAVSSVLWLLAMSAIASSLGGYIAGRLRVRWLGVPLDEVHFRDTAHGFLAWAVATLLTAALLTSAAGTLIDGAANSRLGQQVSAETLAANDRALREEYFVDTLFRSGRPNTGVGDYNAQLQAGRILSLSLEDGVVDSADRAHLVQMVAAQTGLTQAESELRVTQTIEAADAKMAQIDQAARETADAARKTTAKISLWIFVSLLIGAFCASAAATLGGRQRDRVVTT